MAASTVSVNGGPTDDATFRAACSAVHNGILATGWLQTADTGQINLATVAKPSGTATIAGFAVYKMNDALQATVPVFLKVSYGSGSSATNLRFTVQVGFTTDNAGTFTGAFSTAQAICATAAFSGATTCYFSGTSSRLNLLFWPASGANICGLVIVERDLDSSGVTTSSGVNLIALNSSIGLLSQFLMFPSPAAVAETKINTLISSQTSQAAGGITGIGPIRTTFGALRNPLIGLLVCSKGDFVTETTTSVSIYGTSHTYISTTLTGAWSTTYIGNNSSYGFLMQYE